MGGQHVFCTVYNSFAMSWSRSGLVSDFPSITSLTPDEAHLDMEMFDEEVG